MTGTANKTTGLAPEQEILLNRLVMGTASGITVYFLAFDSFILTAFVIYLSLNASLFAMRQKNVWPQERRWVAAIILDIGMAFAVMMRSAETMSFFYPLLLWVTLGNGFRYGVKYLVFAATLSVFAFGTVVLTTDYWAPNQVLGYSLTLALAVIPAYCSTLIRKLSKAKDEAETANRAKSYFLASVSHELRTPLNAIIGYGNHLKQMGMPKNQHDMVDASVLAGEHLLHLIDQLIQIARSDSNSAQVVLRPLRLTELFTEIRDIMLVRAEDKSLALQIAAEPFSDRLVDGPVDIMRNILLNLTGNAIKFTEAGTIAVNGGIKEHDGKTRVWFSVTDTGIGIMHDAVERIFEPFQQADETVLNRFGGTGLGLAICKQLVDQVGGHISVTSQIGQGSSFLVEIPVTLATADQQEVPAPQSETTAAIHVLALGSFDADLLSTAQSAGSYVVRNIKCSNRKQLSERLEQLNLDDFDIAMIDDRLIGEIPNDDPLWQLFSDAEVAAVLVSHDKLPDLQEIRLRAAFASVIPSDANFDQLRSAIRIGCSFAHKPHFDHKSGSVTPQIAQNYRPRAVLVADDNRTNRNILAAILESAGHSVTQVCDGDEMLDILEQERFDIVLLDVNMPRLNGIDACKMWRQIEGARSHLPIVGVTADATSETEARCLAAGMDLRLTKPINSGLLLSTIEKCCFGDATEIELPGSVEDPLQIVVPLQGKRPTDGNEAIDPEHMDYLRSIGDDSFVASMIEGFLEDVAECRITLTKSVEERDPALFRFSAHAFKSSANNIGAKQLAALCAKLEKVTEADFESQRVDYKHRIENELERATLALQFGQQTPAIKVAK